MGRLDGRVAFITGAGRGIGAATALRMAEEGARVALADVDTEGSEQVAAELDRLGTEGLVVACNVADSAMVQDAVDKTASHFGRLDILVNNAGVTRDNLLFKMSEDDWDTSQGGVPVQPRSAGVHGESEIRAYRLALLDLRAGQSRAGELFFRQGRLARFYAHVIH